MRCVLCVCLVTQSCLTLCDPMDCSPPGSSVHGILQAKILEWVAMPFSRGSSQPRDRTQVSCFGRWVPYRLSHQGRPPSVLTLHHTPLRVQLRAAKSGEVNWAHFTLFCLVPLGFCTECIDYLCTNLLTFWIALPNVSEVFEEYYTVHPTVLVPPLTIWKEPRLHWGLFSLITGNKAESQRQALLNL